jgi:hypothetical protein
MRAAHALNGVGEHVAGGSHVDLRITREREQQVLGGDVLVAEPAGLVVGAVERVDRALVERRGLRRVAADRGQRVELLVRAPPHGLRVGVRAPQDGHDDAAFLLEQAGEQVKRVDLGVALRGSELLRRGERLLGLDREAVRVHLPTLPASAP